MQYWTFTEISFCFIQAFKRRLFQATQNACQRYVWQMYSIIFKDRLQTYNCHEDYSRDALFQWIVQWGLEHVWSPLWEHYYIELNTATRYKWFVNYDIDLLLLEVFCKNFDYRWIGQLIEQMRILWVP